MRYNQLSRRQLEEELARVKSAWWDHAHYEEFFARERKKLGAAEHGNAYMFHHCKDRRINAEKEMKTLKRLLGIG